MFVTLPTGPAFVRLRGDGPPVLFVHGFPLTGDMWLPAAERLADRFGCIIPDLRGHGHTPPTPAVSIGDFADDLAHALDALREARRVALVGLSLGGIIGFEFFRRHRARLAALVLADTRANAESPDGIERRRSLARAVLDGGSRAAVEAMLPQLFGPAFPAAQRERWAALMRSNPPQGVAAASIALAERPDSHPTLPRIDCPTLAVVGEDDAITPPALMRDIHSRIPGARFESIPGAGHVPPLEQPQAFADCVRAFLSASA